MCISLGVEQPHTKYVCKDIICSKKRRRHAMMNQSIQQEHDLLIERDNPQEIS